MYIGEPGDRRQKLTLLQRLRPYPMREHQLLRIDCRMHLARHGSLHPTCSPVLQLQQLVYLLQCCEFVVKLFLEYYLFIPESQLS